MSPNRNTQHSPLCVFRPYFLVAPLERIPLRQVAELMALEKQTRSLAGTFEDLNANFGKINQSMSGASWPSWHPAVLPHIVECGSAGFAQLLGLRYVKLVCLSFCF